MTTGRIRFSTEILRRLGEELNPNPDQGILELVKNAYDADAKSCSVELSDVGKPNGCVWVTDDGDGMDAEAIENGWLVIGRSQKATTSRTRLGRIPAGSKGLGRLAALRLGNSATLVTRPRGEPNHQYELCLDWKAFDDVTVVEDVPLQIHKLSRPEGASSGTEILLKDLRPRIGRLDAKRLARALLLLADPFSDDPGSFSPTLTSKEFTDLENLVSNRYFSEADYHLVAKLGSGGRAKVEVLDWKGKTIFAGGHKDVSDKRSGAPYQCPKVRFDLWAFILTADTFRNRSTTLSEVRAWLGQFGGVHVYYNGLRVAPYGNLGNDWLDMNLRRVQSPEERPGTNSAIGRVMITDQSSSLIEKTDRSGFVENPQFFELRELARDSLEWMARRRLEVAERRRGRERQEAVTRSSRAKVSVEKALESVPQKARTDVKAAFSRYERTRENEVKALKREVQLYRTLSTAGITAATFAHEAAGNPIKAITNSIKAIERRGRKALGRKYAEVLEKPVEAVLKAIGSLSVLGNSTLRLLRHDKRRIGRVDINKVIADTLDTLEPFLSARRIEVRRELCLESPYLRGTEAAVESVITNLVNNSIVALESKTRRQINITTTVAREAAVIRVSDNGPGIEDISVKDIWLPGETTRANGTGLGLTIVRDAVADLGGQVDATEHGQLGGATFTVTLPILGS